MESLRLTIPSQQEGQHILVETNHGRLSEWLRSLPLADMSKTLPEITRAITSLNRTELRFKQRAELIELFDTTYQFIHDYFRPKCSGGIKNNQLAKQNMEKLHNLTREMAFAHKIIVNDSQHKRQLWGKNKFKAKSMAFSIYYLGLMLIEQYENYTPVPIYLWREINALFAHAGKEELQHIEVTTSARSHCLPTVEQNYNRNCLIALSDPYHLDKGEHWQVFYYLQSWIHLARISEDPDDFRNEECFIIDVTSENKPVFVTSELDDPEDPKIRLLLTFDLIKQVNFDSENAELKNKIPTSSFHPSISLVAAQTLWMHLATHWKQRIERDSRRYPIVTKVDIVWGLKDVCRLLACASQNGRKTLSFDEIKVLTKVKAPENLTWDATNVSSGGIGLCSRQYMIPHIHLGDITLIREYMDGKPSLHWRLALCCWLTGDKHNGTMLGLKYIDGQYEPVRLVLHQGKNEKGGQPGILVTNAPVEGNKSASIITSKGSSQGDRVYALLSQDKPKEIKPRVKIESTPCIERFFFQSYEMRQELAQEVEEEAEEAVPWTAIPHEQGNIDDHFDTENAPEEAQNVITLDNLRLPGDH